MSRSVCSILMVVLATGCTAQQNDPALSADTSELALVVSGGKEYRHTPERSLFHAGDIVEARTEGGFDKLVGKEGVFAVDGANGWGLAIPNGDSSAEKAPPLTDSADEHNARVLAYFQAAGLPAAEIGKVHANTLMKGGMAASGARERDELLGFISVVERRVDGIRVPDSFAWARFNANDEVVAEGVFWPSIPADVVRSALKLQQHLADIATRKSFVASLATSDQTLARESDGEVVVHHSAAADHRPPESVAAFDVIAGKAGSHPRIEHFDALGRQIFLTHEVAPKRTSEGLRRTR